jgi:hypothetical protein
MTKSSTKQKTMMMMMKMMKRAIQKQLALKHKLEIQREQRGSQRQMHQFIWSKRTLTTLLKKILKTLALMLFCLRVTKEAKENHLSKSKQKNNWKKVKITWVRIDS